jgi:hypothetical protein
MEITEPITRKLLRLIAGERIPASSLKHAIIQQLYKEQVIQKQVKGRNQTAYYCSSPQYLEAYIRNNHGINDLERYLNTLENKDATRADLVEAASNSKIKKKRTLEGFFVTSFEPINTTLLDQQFIIDPQFGASVFINEYRKFLPAQDVLIVGVENAENFKFVAKQKYLFEGQTILFVFKHPQSNDLIKWLELIPNRYLHFGDFDFCGLTIYYSQYKSRLGEKCSLFIPPMIEIYIASNGNSELYDDQLRFEPKDEALLDKDIKKLVDLIHRNKKGLEQELFTKQHLFNKEL